MNIDYQKYQNTASFALKESKKESARDDKQTRIEKLWSVLLALHANGEWNFSVSAIGKKLEEHGIQKAQSYRNPQGKDYREIVEAFAQDWGVKTTHLQQSKSTPLDDAISSIQDRDAQARIRMAITEVARLKAQNEQLRHQMSKMTEVRYGKAISQNVLPLNETRLPSTGAPPLDKPAVGSVAKFLEDDWMFGHDLTVDGNGVLSCGGQVITLPRFYSQLTALLDYVASS